MVKIGALKKPSNVAVKMRNNGKDKSKQWKEIKNNDNN